MLKKQHLSAARWLAFAVFVLGGTAGLGCGGPEATVTGKVTYNGKPLPSGTVTFIKDGANPASGQINADGSYLVEYAPIGECTVMVVTQTANSNPMDPGSATGPKGMKGNDPKDKDKLKPGQQNFQEDKDQKKKDLRDKIGPLPGEQKESIAIPPKYGSPQSSPLKYAVKKGKNHIDIELTD